MYEQYGGVIWMIREAPTFRDHKSRELEGWVGPVLLVRCRNMKMQSPHEVTYGNQSAEY
jgi:hypothetical protein